MQLKYINSASVLISEDDTSIICDPWLVGTSFNDGWAMYPQPNLTKIDYEFIYDYLYMMPSLIRPYWTGAMESNPRLDFEYL